MKTGHPHASVSELIDALYGFMDEDRKSTALKALQGIIWHDGYVNGDFTGHLYPDVLPALEKWKAQGIDLYVILLAPWRRRNCYLATAMKVILLICFSGYFDTRIGAKREVQSYQNIAAQTGIPGVANSVPVGHSPGAGRR
ncbi:enolase-phosphatase E1 [Enterobacter cancerogenus]|uniref:Enolase-phosphatase E1 n=1 Tax=Enterobacter cancerogenus TaxID=69218 RepID=A0A484X1W0_9ENTR|nr:enolase-phosphatase E1 [Enterobacter cancerogenus]